ncbi:uncharacterized protein LOC120992942 isoform X2 [Bufo bufo]|nr:uncharacterized protein LOC120992942 isoform X2 [Bufo bufo]
MPHRRIMFFYLATLLLLQKLGGGHCTVTLLQPPAITAMRGSSVNLSCQLQLNGVKVARVNLYWLVPDANDKVKEYLYPRPKLRSTRINNSRLVYPVFINDLSLTIDDVQPSYSDTYICETSLVIGLQNQRSTGKGTYLLVYEELMTFINHSDIVCQVKVQGTQNVDLVWEFQGQEYDSVSSSLIPSPDNSYWIISVLSNWTQWCQNQQNTTFTCKLRYMEQSLVERNIQDTCAGDLPASHSAPQPILLYVLILGNTLLILLIIIIIIFFWKKKEKKRRIQVVAPYAKFSSSSKTKYNG